MVETMKRVAVIALIAGLTAMVIALGACQTTGERLAEWGYKCDLYGYEHGTQEFAKCVQKEETRWQRQMDNTMHDQWYDHSWKRHGH